MRHDFSIDARGLRMRRALVALGEAVARYTPAGREVALEALRANVRSQATRS
jgi:hypothetical protein